MKRPPCLEPQRIEPGPGAERDLTVSGSRTGAFVTAVIVLIAFIALTLARPFLIGTVVAGWVVSVALWAEHNQRPGGEFAAADKSVFNFYCQHPDLRLIVQMELAAATYRFCD